MDDLSHAKWGTFILVVPIGNAKFRVLISSVQYDGEFGAARIRELRECNLQGKGKFRMNGVG